jgi:hypothetical protein
VWDRAERVHFQAVIQAAPGTFVLQPITGDCDNDSSLAQETVIGWGINGWGHSVPITADGAAEDDLAVLMPNGEVVEPQGGTYPSVEAYTRAKEEEPTNPFWPPNQKTKAA